MLRKSIILWGIFILLFVVVTLNQIWGYLGMSFTPHGRVIWALVLILPITLLVLHSFWTLSILRGILFISLGSIIGLATEVIGLNSGVLFGGRYVYQADGLALFSVPLVVILFWAVFTYTSYCMVTSFLYWLKKAKPSIKNGKAGLLPLLILADGLVVVAIDLFMDPIHVKLGSWTWLDSGPYFGIPTGNFIGWFIVAILITGSFRLFEYFYPQQRSNIDRSVYIMPVIGYGVMALSFAFTAMQYQMYDLALIGTILMLPIALINAYFFISSSA